jgi:hypothetical protein
MFFKIVIDTFGINLQFQTNIITDFVVGDKEIDESLQHVDEIQSKNKIDNTKKNVQTEILVDRFKILNRCIGFMKKKESILFYII